MSGLVFLGVIVVVTLLGWLVLWFRFREPRSWDAQMHEFRRTLSALSPDQPLPDGERRDGKAPARGRRAG